MYVYIHIYISIYIYMSIYIYVIYIYVFVFVSRTVEATACAEALDSRTSCSLAGLQRWEHVPSDRSRQTLNPMVIPHFPIQTKRRSSRYIYIYIYIFSLIYMVLNRMVSGVGVLDFWIV